MDRKKKEYDLYRKTRQAEAIKWLIQDKKRAYKITEQIEEISKKFEFYRGINKAMIGR
ncbi:MAG: hypothetical protein IJL74_04820 [Bacilli bacterium]|nr:hypothetical protein [Bacilli bacterium]